MKILTIFGTRPEAIKMAPVIKQLEAYPDEFQSIVCSTGQHKEMLDQVLDFFSIKPDYSLDIMEPNQTLPSITAKILNNLEPIIKKEQPDFVIVQGDTTTTFVAALNAFYHQIPVVHLEAGLRTGNMYSPFPEELNRVMTSKIATFHFAPTQKAVDNLLAEQINPSHIYNVGNTVVDALVLATGLIKNHSNNYAETFENIDFSKKIILVTAHRRESIGEGFSNIANAIKEIAHHNKDTVEIVFPIHYNPAIRKAAKDAGLYDIPNVHIINPLDYPHLVYIMQNSYLILTDSGGIQEEAPSLGKPVLVMRDTTERPEGIEAGVAKLVGTKQLTIITETQTLLDDKLQYEKMSNAVNPYGDGTTSQQIVNILKGQK